MLILRGLLTTAVVVLYCLLSNMPNRTTDTSNCLLQRNDSKVTDLTIAKKTIVGSNYAHGAAPGDSS